MVPACRLSTRRVATAVGEVLLGQEAFALVEANKVAKGDVLSVAKVAGVCGAKQTANLIPLCHNIRIDSVDVQLELRRQTSSVHIRATATATGPTGVEMEALTAVSVAALTVYDMTKSVSKAAEIRSIYLESKTGGKSGDYRRGRCQG